jgi:hypothetical protein
MLGKDLFSVQRCVPQHISNWSSNQDNTCVSSALKAIYQIRHNSSSERTDYLFISVCSSSLQIDLLSRCRHRKFVCNEKYDLLWIE